MSLEGRPDHESEATGYERVDTNVSCMLTRFHLRSALSLIHFYRSYRRVRAESRRIPGLLKTVFLIENARTCYTLSIWANSDAIYDFNGQVNSHVDAANSSIRHLKRGATGVELWSAQFRLSAISEFNLRWDTFDIRPHVTPTSPTRHSHVA
jgi:hypothetical protein